MTERLDRNPVFGYLGSFVVLGLSLSLLGPALSVLRHHTQSSVSGISALFVAQGIGYLAGSIVSGRMYDARGGNRLLATGCAVSAAATLCLPAVSSLGVLCLLCAVLGAVCGIIDVGGNTLVVWQLGSNSGGWLAALHCCFGVGALCTPLVVAWSVDSGNDLWLSSAVTAAIGLGVAGYLLVTPTPTHAADVDPRHEPLADRAVLAVISVFFVIYVGMELGFAGWVHSWAEDVRLPGVGGAALTAGFWAAFTGGRLAGIVVARRFRPGAILVASSCLSVAAAWVFVAGGGSSPLAAWTATLLLGLGLSPQFPTMISFAESRVRLTGSATSWFIGAAAAGSLVLPWVIGQLFDRVGPPALPAVVAVSATACLIWVLVIRSVTDRRQGRVVITD